MGKISTGCGCGKCYHYIRGIVSVGTAAVGYYNAYIWYKWGHTKFAYASFAHLGLCALLWIVLGCMREKVGKFYVFAALLNVMPIYNVHQLYSNPTVGAELSLQMTTLTEAL